MTIGINECGLYTPLPPRGIPQSLCLQISATLSRPASRSLRTVTSLHLSFVLALFLAAFLIVPGCGYHFAVTGDQAPGNINSIAVDVLENRTALAGIEAIFTNAILTEFVRWKKLPVKPHSEAEGILGGSIARISTEDVSHSRPEKTLETRVTVTLALTLKRAETNEILWENPDLSYFEEYFETGDALLTDRLRREAVREIAKFLAERIHNDIFEAF